MLLAWIRNFLIGRSQFVSIAGACSKACTDINGVPQGSVLGPALFSVYVNNLCDLIPSGVTVKLFADDAKLYSVFCDSFTSDCLQSCLTAISDWSDHWQLKLSPTKCPMLHVCPARRRNENNSFVYHIGNTALPSVDYINDLGVIMTPNCYLGITSITLFLRRHCVLN